jgi:tRNA modification GTPase
MMLYTRIEAIINFPEDGLDADNRAQIHQQLKALQEDVERLLEGSKSGRLLKEGVRVVLCGRPNVGKSSLLNALLKESRAIVTPVAGTTRDALEELAQFKGIPVALVDTAGILNPRDIVEEHAIKRSRQHMNAADLRLLVLDQSEPLYAGDLALLEELKGDRVLIVLNKKDLACQVDIEALARFYPKEDLVTVSAFDPESVDKLEAAMVGKVAQFRDFDAHGVLVSNTRHIKALEQAGQGIKEAVRLIGEGVSFEFASLEIKDAVNQLDGISGRNIDEDLLEAIFARFCIGK